MPAATDSKANSPAPETKAVLFIKSLPVGVLAVVAAAVLSLEAMAFAMILSAEDASPVSLLVLSPPFSPLMMLEIKVEAGFLPSLPIQKGATRNKISTEAAAR